MKNKTKWEVEKRIGQFGLSQSGESYKKLTELALQQLKEDNKVCIKLSFPPSLIRLPSSPHNLHFAVFIQLNH